MIKEAISMLVSGESLDEVQSTQCMQEILAGLATPAQIAAFLTALRMKGEAVDEIYGLAKVLREGAIRINAPEKAVDLCGTGGDASNSFNISTAASLVVAAAGVPVAKHGNKSITSKCGSADILEALGANINLSPAEAEAVLKRANITFLFAQRFHPAMKNVASIRRELGVRMVFNLIGPMINPALVKYQLIGVYDPLLTRKVAEVMVRLGLRKVLVVHCGGMDELSLHAPITVTEASNGKIESYEINGSDFGLKACSKEDLLGQGAQENAKLLKEIFAGRAGAYRDAVVLNAAAALYACQDVASIEKGISVAEKTIDSGRARDALENFVEATNQYVPSKN